ncbi:hypothetical protein RclHR1_02360025 [Rhizophagus clarus]|nr:hypothetical protein RclHR1_02360025 [Rhizophagus clarus]
MVYVINGDIKELAMIGAITSRGTASVSSIEIIWDEGLRVKGCNESFIGESEVSTSLCEAPLSFFFNAN